MIETPAAALAAPDILQHAEFLSFGTNDLTQYTFAADRENAAGRTISAIMLQLLNSDSIW